MPFFKNIKINSKTTLYLWKISEELSVLQNQIQLKESSQLRLQNMKAESHQKGFLAVRMLLQHIGYTDDDLVYDENGKPNLSEIRNPKIRKSEISISHSHQFSAIAISTHEVGLDIEILKPKTLKIAPRFMDISHLENLQEQEKIKKATVIWGIKEAIFKIKSEPGISFQDHIFEDKFNFEDKKAIANLKYNNQEEKFKATFNSFEEYIFVVVEKAK